MVKGQFFVPVPVEADEKSLDGFGRNEPTLEAEDLTSDAQNADAEVVLPGGLGLDQIRSTQLPEPETRFLVHQLVERLQQIRVLHDLLERQLLNLTIPRARQDPLDLRPRLRLELPHVMLERSPLGIDGNPHQRIEFQIDPFSVPPPPTSNPLRGIGRRHKIFDQERPRFEPTLERKLRQGLDRHFLGVFRRDRRTKTIRMIARTQERPHHAQGKPKDTVRTLQRIVCPSKQAIVCLEVAFEVVALCVSVFDDGNSDELAFLPPPPHRSRLPFFGAQERPNTTGIQVNRGLARCRDDFIPSRPIRSCHVLT